MASVTSSPIRSRPLASSNAIHEGRTISSGGGGGGGGRKRRHPIDPPEDSVDVDEARPYDSEVLDMARARHRADKRRRDDDGATTMGWLSLRPPDPPANYHPSCGKRKIDDDDDVEGGDGRPAKRPEATARIDQMGGRAGGGHAGADGASNRRLTIPGDDGRDVGVVEGSASIDDYDDVDVDMAIDDDAEDDDDDDDDRESDGDCGGSVVSEGSIRNAMYQLVFGRWSPPSPMGATVGGGGGGGVGRYDVVDSKIEDLIRRSRLEAVIRSRGGGGEGSSSAAAAASSSSSDVEMNDDVTETEGDGDDFRAPRQK